jgi:hypothetical protein
MLQCEPVQKLHGDESVALVLSDVINSADVGMVQGRCRLRLALEAGERLRVLRYFIGQKLQSDEAMETGVFGFVHHTHPATAELLDNAVMRYGLANH